jgi:hypothetical protein
MKLKYRTIIHDIVRSIILENIKRSLIVAAIRKKIKEIGLLTDESNQLLQIIEIEIASLHEGNIARFKIRPSEFQAWKSQ